MTRLSPIDSVHLIWPHLEAALIRVKEKTGERWAPPFVFERIVSGQAGLFRLHDEGTHVAYLVCERYEQGESPWMNVWILSGDGMADEVNAEVVALLDGLAKQIGATSWRFTGRKGWGRALKGFIKPVATVYERTGYG